MVARFTFIARFPQSPQPVAEISLTPHPALQGRRVLVADADPIQRETIAENLEALGMRPTTCFEGEAVLKSLKQAGEKREPFAVALLDARLPQIDGTKLAMCMRDDPTLWRIPVVLLAQVGRRGGEKLSAANGVSATLGKPMTGHELARAVLEQLQTDQVATEKPRVTPVAGSGRSARILIAEDNTINLQVARALLEKYGHQVFAVHDGRQAIERVERERFDLVLMDVQMPVMDGIAATAIIRRKESLGEIAYRTPIVALTARVTKEDSQRVLRAGMDGFVTKPFRPADVLATVERFTEEPEKPPAEEDASDRTLDTQRLREQVVGERDLFEEIAGMFFGQKEEILQDLADAIEREDARTIERRAHRLKGTLGNLAAADAAEAAERLEEIGRGGKLEAAGPAFSDLRALAEDVTSELKHLLTTDFPQERNG